MKKCCTCGEYHDESNYQKDKQKIDGLDPRCKPCRKIARRKFYLKNRKKELKKNAKWRRNNHEKQLFLQRRHYQENKSIYVEKVVRRKAHVKRATPVWLSKKQLKQLKELYRISALLSETTGIPWHVDHELPLNGTTVCGLHVPENLGVIRGSENLSKGNKLII